MQDKFNVRGFIFLALLNKYKPQSVMAKNAEPETPKLTNFPLFLRLKFLAIGS